MDEVRVVRLKDAKVEAPIFIEGLPGIGNVGKLVAEHLIDELNAEKIIEIYSPHLPPQVMVREDGTIRMMTNDIYHGEIDGRHLLILVGESQSVTNTGHYILSETYVKIAKEFGARRIYTLGGYGTGTIVERPYVIGAANKPELVEEMKKYGVIFKEDEPGGGIVGASGLILGFARMEEIEAVCLMGVTSGYMVDPKSAQAVLEVLQKILGISVDTTALQERAAEMEKFLSQLRELERASVPRDITKDEDLGYIR
jgi:hypothetical protein